MPSPDVPHGHLSKHQKNKLFQVIESSGVPITEFELDEEDAPVTVLCHTASGSEFSIRTLYWEGSPVVRTFIVEWRIGDREEFSRHAKILSWRDNVPSWATVVRMAKNWTAQINYARKHEAARIREAEEYERASDLWEELRRGREFFAGESEEEPPNTPFDADEQARISQQIREIKAYIKTTYELTGEQITRVEARLDHAEEASRRIGRKDLIILFNGAVFSLILTDTITPVAAQHVILTALHGASHLFGIGGPPPSLPPGG